MPNEERKNAAAEHNVIMENRSNMSISGVNDVDSFDDRAIKAYTEMGGLLIKGSDLHIEKLSVESGELKVEGRIDSLEYSEGKRGGKSVFSKIFK